MASNPTTQDKRGILERNFDGKFNSLFPAGDKPDAGGGEPDPVDPPPPTGGDVTGNIVSDGFESGDFSAPGNSGFQWNEKTGTSIVTMSEAGNPTVIHTPSAPTYNELVGDTRDWSAFEGNNCLRFRYAALSDWTEQRFGMTQAHPEIWMAYWIRIPDNFAWDTGSTKFFSLWTDGYSAQGDGSTVWMNYYGDGSMAVTHSLGGNTTSLGYEASVPVFDPVNDRGVWFKFVVQAKVESSTGASDGVLRVWNKRQGNASLTLSHEQTDWAIKLPDTGPQGFSEGYLMGWANGGYAEDTEWLLDNFNLSTESLL